MITLRRLLIVGSLAAVACGFASANTLLVVCGGFSQAGSPGNNGYFATTTGVASGSVTCAGVSQSTIGAGNVFLGEQIILNADFTGGDTTSAGNTTQTVFTAGTFANTPSDPLTTDTITVSGLGGSSTYSDTFADPGNADGQGAQYFFDDSYNDTSFNAGGTINYSVNITAGNVQGVSGNVYELLSFQSATPEPGTLFLMGSALVGAGLWRKRRKS